MGKRHEAIGIKQAIRIEWMQKTANLLLAGFDSKSIRQELHEYLKDKRGNGSEGERSSGARSFLVINLMNIWVSPDTEIIPFRDALLSFLQVHPAMFLPIHWGMLSAAYPFWFNVAKQTGRLLALQDQVTQMQIINRLKEQYGDRQTVSRYAQFVIRSFVAWGVLRDSAAKGCYEKATPISISDSSLVIFLVEAALHANPDSKGAMGLLLNNPAFFPFQLPAMTGEFISQRNVRIDVERYGLDDELLKLKGK